MSILAIILHRSSAAAEMWAVREPSKFIQRRQKESVNKYLHFARPTERRTIFIKITIAEEMHVLPYFIELTITEWAEYCYTMGHLLSSWAPFWKFSNFGGQNLSNYDKWYPKLAPKKKNFDQNCERRSQFSVFEATSWASYDQHLSNDDKWYPKLAPKKKISTKKVKRNTSH